MKKFKSNSLMISLTDTSEILPGIHLIASLTIVMGFLQVSFDIGFEAALKVTLGFITIRMWLIDHNNVNHQSLSGARSLFL